MLKILQARLQQYMNWELPDAQAGFRKGRATRNQIANNCWIIEKAKQLHTQKSTSASFTTWKPLSVWTTTNCGKFLKEMGLPDHLTCLLRHLCAGQDTTVRTGHRTMDWFKIEKGVRQGCILSPCLFDLHAEYIMQNARLDDSQEWIKLPRDISTASGMQMIPL